MLKKLPTKETGLNTSFPRLAKLILLFLVTFSIVSLPGPLSKNLQLPNFGLGHACVSTSCFCITHGAGGACSDYWVPAGPAMDTLQNTIFTDESAEFTDIQSASPSIDLTDWPLTPDLVSTFTISSQFLITAPISLAGYFEVQFLLANNFWGVNMNFGNDAGGVNIRQAVSHLVDKAAFATNEPSIAGTATAIDNPLPTTNIGSLPAANPCNWDATHIQTGPQCVVGEQGQGGLAYHLAAATGANGISWLPAKGSLDFCAAADHFIAAGIALGKDATTCVLQNISTAALAHVPNFFIRSDNPPRLHLGDSIAEQICALFTGSYTIPCAYLNITHGTTRAFPGLTTSSTSVNLSWWFYTAAYGSATGTLSFDSSLYFRYNSHFVSGIPSIQGANLCDPTSVPTFSAPNDMYLCNPGFDSVSTNMEFSPCLTSPTDPAVGQPNNGSGSPCVSDPTKNSAISLGLRAEDLYGQGAYTMPIFEQKAQFGYLNNGWLRVPTNDGVGIPNYFTWLSAWNPNPAQPGTLRQAFKQSTSTVDPYNSGTVWDAYMDGNIYDSLGAPNPLNGGQLMNWMTVHEQQLNNSALLYTPPSGTTQTFRFTLRSDMFFQDGRKVTSFDVAFSYLSEKGTGSFPGAGAAAMTGFTIVGPSQFDINVVAAGPTTLLALTGLYILPGRYWTNVGASAWDSAVSACVATGAACYSAQYNLGGPNGSGSTPTCITGAGLTCAFSASNFNWDPAKITASYDPIANHILIGSSGWECGTPSALGFGCSSSGVQNPGAGGSYTLQRFGKGLAPASSISGIYFRSSGNLALYAWSQDNGDIVHDFLNFSVVAACFGKPAEPLGSTSACGHFQQGIGANGGPVAVGLNQVAIVNRFVGLNWVSPFNWVSSPPTGIVPFPPVLYEGSYTSNPASLVGCSQHYPIGGYDC